MLKMWYVVAPAFLAVAWMLGYLSVDINENGLIVNRIPEKWMRVYEVLASFSIFMLLSAESYETVFEFLDHGNGQSYSAMAELLVPFAIGMLALGYFVVLHDGAAKIKGWHTAELEWLINSVERRLRKEFDRSYGDEIQTQRKELALYKEGPRQDTLLLLSSLKVIDFNKDDELEDVGYDVTI